MAGSLESVFCSAGPPSRRVGRAAANRRILVLVAHLHEDRTRKQDRDYLQSMAGLHVASLLDRDQYQVRLYHEMWHGPYPTQAIKPGDYAVVFLTGLQMDFDRMRQLSYFFRDAGATVVAGGSICSLFPEFAAQFFDAVCAGGVECVVDVMQDYARGSMQPVYRSPQSWIAEFEIDYRFMRKNGIRVPVHFIEASRGCNFKCDFCSIPAEKARHAAYDIRNVARNIDNSIRSSPHFSISRLYPFVFFIDNNFSNNLPHLRRICELLKGDKRVKMWGALVTGDVLRNRALVKLMADAKCRDLFTGIESIGEGFNESHDKRQNAKSSATLFDDLAYAESLGMMIRYGYLFDPRTTSIEQMQAELRFILRSDVLHHPYFVAFVAPLAGTKLFWQAADGGELLPNLRLRDVEGRCIAYRNTIDGPDALGRFAATIFGTPNIYSDRKKSIARFWRHAWRHGRKNPVLSYLFYLNRTRLIRLGRNHRTVGRNYIGGREILDPQYSEYPADIAPEDKERYFDPILLTDAEGRAAEWLERYRPGVLARAAGAL